MRDYTDEEIAAIGDLREIETIKDKPFYRCMGDEFTNQKILSDVFGAKNIFEITEKFHDFYDVQDKFMEVVKPMLESGELFAQVLQKNDMHAFDYLVENFSAHSYLIEQVIEQQAPYLNHYVSNKDWFDGESYEVDKELLGDFHKEYCNDNGNSDLAQKVKRYFDSQFSDDWDITRKILDNTQFQDEYKLLEKWCKDISEVVSKQKIDGQFDQNALNSWLKVKLDRKELAPEDKDANQADFVKFSKMFKLKESLEAKSQRPPGQGNVKERKMKI